MTERPGSIPDRLRGLNGDERAEPAASPGRWWSLENVVRTAPEEVRFLVERLGPCLFLGAEEAAKARADSSTGKPELVDLEMAGAAVDVLRDAISTAESLGAPTETVRLLHRRLDREAFELARYALGQCLVDNRSLLRDVSHDLRSPLNSILFLADTLLSEHSGELNTVQRRQVGVLYTAAVTLVGLVNDLIDASHLGESQELSVAHIAFSMEAVLSDVKSLLGPLALHRGVDLGFHLETVGPRSGDRQLLSRVLINLVTNAIQATGEDGRVEVHVTEPRPGWLRVEVRDDGSTADLEHLRRLIAEDADPYRSGRTRGWTHGLGLAISAQLVRAAGGSVVVESLAGEGTRFRVELPFHRVA